MNRPAQTGAGPVDVLSNLVEYVEDFRQEPETECRAALAAVAELVEAARAELSAEDDNGVARERLAAALAKFGGV